MATPLRGIPLMCRKPSITERDLARIDWLLRLERQVPVIERVDTIALTSFIHSVSDSPSTAGSNCRTIGKGWCVRMATLRQQSLAGAAMGYRTALIVAPAIALRCARTQSVRPCSDAGASRPLTQAVSLPAGGA